MSQKKYKNNTNKCWEQIGIWGDSTCPKLTEFVHCHNCTDYFKAARSLFDREIPEGYREEWTNLLARSEETEIHGTIFVIVFRLRNEWLALRAGYIQEVTEILPVHPVPFRSNKMFKGLTNINGELIPCISATDIFELSGDIEQTSKHIITTHMIVVSKNGERFVFPVDEIMGIRCISLDDQQKTPATLSKSATTHSTGVFSIDGKTVGLLDEVKFLNSLQRSLTY